MIFSAMVSNVVKHLTQSTGTPYGGGVISCGKSGKVLHVILNMYNSLKSCRMMCYGQYHAIIIGLHQGFALSPLLLILTMNVLASEFEHICR